MPAGVEMIDRVDKSDPEAHLDLGGLAGLEISEELLEDADVSAPRDGAYATLNERPHDDIDVDGGPKPVCRPSRGTAPRHLPRPRS